MTQPKAPATTGAQPFLKGSIIWRKYGPLPVWAWAGIVLLLALVFTFWRRNKAAAADSNEETTGYEQLPGDQTSPPVFILPPWPNTVPAAPPGGGRPSTPIVAPKMPAPPYGFPVGDIYGRERPTPYPAPKPGPAPTVPKPAPLGGYVSVTSYPDRTAPKESTLWDIAYSWLPSGASYWRSIWTHPLNVDLYRKRSGNERSIRAGDKLFVPNKLRTYRR